MYFLQKKTYVQKTLFTETIFKYVQEQAADTLIMPTGLADISRVLGADIFPTLTMANLLASPIGTALTQVAPLPLRIGVKLRQFIHINYLSNAVHNSQL